MHKQDADELFAQADLHIREGRDAEAEIVARDILARNPDHADAKHLLGFIASKRGDYQLAHRLVTDAIEAEPGKPAYYFSLGVIHKNLGGLEEAANAFRQVIELVPNHAPAYLNLGAVLKGMGRLDEALEVDDRAIQLGLSLDESYSSRAAILRDLGRLDEALLACEQAIGLNPDNARSHLNLGVVLRDLGRIDAAVAACDCALTIDPQYAEARLVRASLWLLAGDLDRGFREYEWRWRTKGFQGHRGHFSKPQWTGGRLSGKTILLYAEQGLGDTLQFIRYVPVVAQSGGRILVACQSSLLPLLAGMPGIDQLVDENGVLPDFDVQASLMSLPFILQTRLDTIPHQIPYLFPRHLPSPAVGRVAMDAARKNVGIAWGGRPEHVNDRNRSIHLTIFRPLLEVPGIKWFSLQVGEQSRELQDAEGFGDVEDTGMLLANFADTAAIIQQLDLVISVDTSVAHLAGALGCPTWLLLPFIPDWRWMLKREDSPWYPCMRLFRQPRRGDWESVLELVHHTLKDFAG